MSIVYCLSFLARIWSFPNQGGLTILFHWHIPYASHMHQDSAWHKDGLKLMVLNECRHLKNICRSHRGTMDGTRCPWGWDAGTEESQLYPGAWWMETHVRLIRTHCHWGPGCRFNSQLGPLNVVSFWPWAALSSPKTWSWSQGMSISGWILVHLWLFLGRGWPAATFQKKSIF